MRGDAGTEMKERLGRSHRVTMKRSALCCVIRVPLGHSVAPRFSGEGVSISILCWTLLPVYAYRGRHHDALYPLSVNDQARTGLHERQRRHMLDSPVT
jgi:hypothetical protein